MHRVRKIAVRVTAGIGVGTALWFGWGAYVGLQVDRKAAELRARGDLAPWRDLVPATPEPGTDGWGVLAEADELRSEADSAFCDGEDAALFEWSGPQSRSAAEWTPKQRAAVGRYLVTLDAYFDKLEGLERYAVLAGRIPTTPFEVGANWMFVSNAIEKYALAARRDPTRQDWAFARMSRLLDRWRWSPSVGPLLAAALWRTPLGVLRDGLERSSEPLPLRAAWILFLQRAEARLLAACAAEPLVRRALGWNVIQAWRRGEAPMAEARRTLRKAADLIADTPVDTEGQLRSGLKQASLGMEPPWYVAWYGRPLLQEQALDMLEEWDGERLGPCTWEVLVRRLVGGSFEQPVKRVFARDCVRTKLMLRLARIALGAPGVLEPWLAERIPVETRDGRRTIRVGDRALLRALDDDYASLTGEALRACLRKDGLLWDVATR